MVLFLNPFPGSCGYHCMIPGFVFKGRRHRAYIDHLQQILPRAESYPCNFKRKCPRLFSSIDELKEHTKSEHVLVEHNQGLDVNVRTVSIVPIPCKCVLVSCGGRVFNSTRDLSLHINTFHKNEHRPCMFKNCDALFRPDAASRNHFRLQHFKKGDVVLKGCHLLAQSVNPDTGPPIVGAVEHLESPSEVPLDLHGDEGDFSEEDMVADPPDDAVEDEKDIEHHCLMSYADFLNRLVNSDSIPVIKVNKIAAEYLLQSQESVKIFSHGQYSGN